MTIIKHKSAQVLVWQKLIYVSLWLFPEILNRGSIGHYRMATVVAISELKKVEQLGLFYVIIAILPTAPVRFTESARNFGFFSY